MQIAAAIAALDDKAHFESTRQKVISERERVTTQLQKMSFDVLPSKANFLLACQKQMSAEDLAALLREQGIIVRHFSKPRIDEYLRVTIGTEEQNNLLIDNLQKILQVN